MLYTIYQTTLNRHKSLIITFISSADRVREPSPVIGYLLLEEVQVIE